MVRKHTIISTNPPFKGIIKGKTLNSKSDFAVHAHTHSYQGQNNQKQYFEVGQRVLEFGQRDGKMYYKIQKIYKKILRDWPQSNCYSGTDPLLHGTGPML